jgi:hypothetical protein
MDLTHLAHDPLTCRWGRRPPVTAAPPAARELVWLCFHPEHVSAPVVQAETCARCERWEPGMLPPCPAIGWA